MTPARILESAELPWTKHATETPAAPPPAARPRPLRKSLGASVAKLVQAARGARGIEVERVAETIARHLEDAGELDEATAVRNEAARVQRMIPVGQSDDGVVEWTEPGSTDDLVLDATCGRHLERLALELEAAPRFIAAGIDAPTRALFYGPSGTGKTLAARWIGARLGLPVAMVRLDQVVGSHLGETAKALSKAFLAANRQASILFLDELDGMSSDRAGGDASAASTEMKRSTTALLQQLDLCTPDRIVIAATNHREQLDAALSRRFSSAIGFSLPDEAARRTMAARWLAKLDVPAASLDAIAKASDGMSGARVRSLAMGAARLAIMGRTALSGEHVRTAAEAA